MKNLLTILSCIFILASCADNKIEETQDYTSFVLINNCSFHISSCIIGYKKSDNTLKLIEDIGDVQSKTTSKEVVIDFNEVKEIFIYNGNEPYGDGLIKYSILVEGFELKQNVKNKHILSGDLIQGIYTAVKDDPTQYPQP